AHRGRGLLAIGGGPWIVLVGVHGEGDARRGQGGDCRGAPSVLLRHEASLGPARRSTGASWDAASGGSARLRAATEACRSRRSHGAAGPAPPPGAPRCPPP